MARTHKENRRAANEINKAKAALDRAMQALENAGQYKEAEALFRMILKLEAWQNAHC